MWVTERKKWANNIRIPFGRQRVLFKSLALSNGEASSAFRLVFIRLTVVSPSFHNFFSCLLNFLRWHLPFCFRAVQWSTFTFNAFTITRWRIYCCRWWCNMHFNDAFSAISLQWRWVWRLRVSNLLSSKSRFFFTRSHFVRSLLVQVDERMFWLPSCTCNRCCWLTFSARQTFCLKPDRDLNFKSTAKLTRRT